jgi:ribonuclease I
LRRLGVARHLLDPSQERAHLIVHGLWVTKSTVRHLPRYPPEQRRRPPQRGLTVPEVLIARAELLALLEPTISSNAQRHAAWAKELLFPPNYHSHHRTTASLAQQSQ